MRIAVLGAGILGVTSAWYLRRDGHEVTVIDRAGAVAGETSFANAGLVAVGSSGSWASPDALRTLLLSLFKPHPAFGMKIEADPHFWLWSLEFLRNCTARRYRRNSRRKLMLSRYSRDCILELEKELNLSYHRNTSGAFYLHRDPRTLDSHAASAERWSEMGVDMARLSPDQVAAQEPALSPSAKSKLAGAIHVPGDFSGDCRLFAEQLVERAVAQGGVRLRLNETVTGLTVEAGRVSAIETDQGSIPCDAAVVALGPETPRLLRRLGARVPIYPAKGYSLTFPLREDGPRPVTCGIDEHYFASYSVLGNHLRITARAEFVGYDRTPDPAVFAKLRAIAEEMFPDSADFDRPSEWVCLRPVTPGGPPILGRVRSLPENLWINAGHGSLGWTMGAGSSRILADLIAGRTPAIDLNQER